MEWNVVITALPGLRREHTLLQHLSQLGEFHPSSFKDVCLGLVADMPRFLEAVRAAREAGEPWTADLGRIIPVEEVFEFAPETLSAQLKEAIAPFLERLPRSASLYVRVERRGLAGKVVSSQVEREVADHLFAQAEARGKVLHASFADPDYVIVAETLGEECGIAFLPRELRSRYSFVHAR